MLDVDHDLALDQQVVIEGERILGEVDHPLDRVLDRNDTDVDLALLDGIEHIGNRSIGDVFGIGEVGLREQRLLGERAEGTEEPHPLRRARCHRSQDYGRRHAQSSTFDYITGQTRDVIASGSGCCCGADVAR